MLERTGIPEIKQGVNIIKDLSADAILREQVRAREYAEHDYYSAISAATRQGIAIGEKKGMDKGRKEGRREGRREGIADILRQMFDAGAIDKNTFDRFSK